MSERGFDPNCLHCILLQEVARFIDRTPNLCSSQLVSHISQALGQVLHAMYSNPLETDESREQALAFAFQQTMIAMKLAGEIPDEPDSESDTTH